MRQANPWQGHLFLEFFSFFKKKKFFSASPGRDVEAFCPFANVVEGGVALREAGLRLALLELGVSLLVVVTVVEF